MKTPFLGTILLKHENNEIKVIDGQQRLTTLSLLLKSIYWFINIELHNDNSDDISDIKTHIRDWLYINKNNSKNLRIVHQNNDSSIYQNVMFAQNDDINNNEFNQRHILFIKLSKFEFLVDKIINKQENNDVNCLDVLLEEKSNNQFISSSKNHDDIYEKIQKIVKSDKNNLNFEQTIKNLKKIKKILIEKKEKTSKIEKSIFFFYQKLLDFCEKDKNKLIKEIYQKIVDKCVIVAINLFDNDNEQYIFDTMNNAGVKLSMVDSIKNILFDKYLHLSGNKNKENLQKAYDSFWKKPLEDSWFNKTGLIGKDNKRTRKEIFFDSFARIEGIFDPNKDKEKELLNRYKAKINGFNTFDDIQNFLEKIQRYANTFFVIFEKSGFDHIKKDDYVTRIKLIINYWRVSPFIPFLLKFCVQEGYNSEKNITEELKNKLQDLEKFLIRTFINNRSSKNFNKECYDLISTKNYSSRFEAFIAKTENLNENSLLFKKDTIYPKIILFLLSLDNLFKTPMLNGLTFSEKDITLEHIWPQTWKTTWKKQFECEMQEKKIEEEYEVEKKVYSLGNMVLVSREQNSSFSNKDFITKKYGIKGKKNSKGYVECLWNSSWDEQVKKLTNSTKEGCEKCQEAEIKNYICEKCQAKDVNKWTLDDIDKRNNSLLKKINNSWPKENKTKN